MTRKRDEPSHPRPPKRVKSSAIDRLVDHFAAAVNAAYRDPVSADIYGIPPSVLVGKPNKFGFADWSIRPYVPIDWVDAMEERLPRPFPALYRSLITRYIFPDFEAGEVRFFANTPEGTAYCELRTRVFDKNLFPTLSRAGYLQIGNPEAGNYDPICFDLSRGDNSDRPLVQIWHEDILLHEIVTVEEEIAPSFQQFMQAVIDAADLQRPK